MPPAVEVDSRPSSIDSIPTRFTPTGRSHRFSLHELSEKASAEEGRKQAEEKTGRDRIKRSSVLPETGQYVRTFKRGR